MNLFGENIAVQTFDAPKMMSKAERLEAMRQSAKAEKNRDCIKAFKKFLVEFNSCNSNFIIADVIEAYKAKRLPLPGGDWRCVGGTVNQLTRLNILVWTGDKRELGDGTGRAMKIYKGK